MRWWCWCWEGVGGGGEGARGGVGWAGGCRGDAEEGWQESPPRSFCSSGYELGVF